jgi:hypothetical protein
MNAFVKNHFLFPQEFHLCSLQNVQNLLFSLWNRFNRTWNRFNRFLDCFSATPALTVWKWELSEKSLQIFLWNRFNRNFSRLNRFWIRSSPRLSRSVNRDLPGGNRFNRFNRFWLFSPNGCQLFGDPLNPPTLSLFITSALSTISQLTKLQTRAFNSHLTPEIASPSIAWRILSVRWSRSNALSISSWFSHSLCSWAHCKLNLVRICYSWSLVLLDG